MSRWWALSTISLRGWMATTCGWSALWRRTTAGGGARPRWAATSRRRTMSTARRVATVWRPASCRRFSMTIARWRPATLARTRGRRLAPLSIGRRWWNGRRLLIGGFMLRIGLLLLWCCGWFSHDDRCSDSELIMFVLLGNYEGLKRCDEAFERYVEKYAQLHSTREHVNLTRELVQNYFR